MNSILKKELPFYNDVVNKKKLQDLMYQTFHNYGVVKSAIIADRIKNLTFHYATRSGISLNAEDLRVPYRKRQLMNLTTAEVNETEEKYETGTITSVERFQKVIDIWNNASNTLKDDVVTYFRESDPLNPLYIMAFSGARGNISQVRQLVGMRGLMADPQGQIIDLPIKSNFREGLKVTEYVISSYGARKGLVDTALRTADSGYLTRRLVDVAQDIIVRDNDCLTKDSLSYDDLFKKYNNNTSFKDRLVGRLLAFPILYKDGKEILFNKDTELTIPIVQSIEKLNIKNFQVRSALTCNSNRSVCRKCYGWHLSYSKLVDLGEAIGIIAAQSIGEPGTQLTMRTFHTGGVFSGDLTRQIRAPFPGTVFYKVNSTTTLIRTIHGEKGFKLDETINLCIENFSGTRANLKIPKGNILLVNNNQKVYLGQVLAEITEDANLIMEEDSKHVYTEVAGETYFQNIEIDNVVDKQGSINTITKKSGLIWVLHGERYSLPKISELKIGIGQRILSNNILATYPIICSVSGIVKFEVTSQEKFLKILNFSLLINNTKLICSTNKNTLIIKNNEFEKKFDLTVKNKEFLKSGQTIAVLNDDTYKTQTGGILCYDINIQNLGSKKSNKNIKKVFSGILYWIPEETHILNYSLINSLLIKPNTIIKAGTEIWPGMFSTIGGLVQLDTVSQELVIKSGELFLINGEQTKRRFEQNCFIKPGEFIIDNLIAEKLCYVEKLKLSGIFYLLVRPVQSFYIPREKGFFIESLTFPTKKEQKIYLKTVKRIFYKNWEHIKSKQGVNLLQTFLVLEVNTKNTTLQTQIEIIRQNNFIEDKYCLKLSLYEIFKTKDLSSKNFNSNIRSCQNYRIKENQFVFNNTIIADVQISTTVDGRLVGFGETKNNTKDILLLKEEDIKEINWQPDKEFLNLKIGDLVRKGGFISNNRKSPYSGQVYCITNTSILIRIGRPHLISEGTILRVKNGNIVQRSDILATLVYEKLKTVDIVQGLPKVEEILEARKIETSCLLAPCTGRAYFKNNNIQIIESNGNIVSIPLQTKLKIRFINGDFIQVACPLTDGQISPHTMLDVLFSYYQKSMPTVEACKLSFKYLQLFLVNETQRTYLAQGVKIADKHIEVIVKQMTSKVRVEESGDTTLLPGEILSLYQADKITQTSQLSNGSPPLYVPILLGLTKASLNSNSFISAASFQETTRVLTEAAIEGKKDWLKGLKENVIIGRLIPAGSGFNCYDYLKKIREKNKEIESLDYTEFQFVKENLLTFRINETTS